ncbi:MAG: formate--tetrahydrofolate ligase, partial [Candidatus Fimimonas sp.]
TFADYTVTEAGFGADLGAEKFLDVKCRMSGLRPNAVVVVATVRALKLHGGASKDNLTEENIPALQKGTCNLLRHVSNVKNVYKLPVVVAVNRFTSDTNEEILQVQKAVESVGVKAICCDVWGKGGKGAKELALCVKQLCDSADNSQFSFAYDDCDDVKEKIRKIATKIYGAKDVEFSEKALDSLHNLSSLGVDEMPVVIAKTQYSFSDDATLLGAPENFTLHIRDVEYRGGAGFVVALAGSMLLMPGLSKTPNAVKMTIDDNGKIDGLY